jgi:hypothetical protein
MRVVGDVHVFGWVVEMEGQPYKYLANADGPPPRIYPAFKGDVIRIKSTSKKREKSRRKFELVDFGTSQQMS